jgi:hypothetical protein
MRLGEPAEGQLQRISEIVSLKHSTRECSVGTCDVYSFLLTNGWIAHTGIVGLKGFGGEIGVSNSRLVGYTLYAGEGWADTMIVYRRRADPLKPFTVHNGGGMRLDIFITNESSDEERKASLDIDLGFLANYSKLKSGTQLYKRDLEALYVTDDEIRRHR